jgi:hypothetical protein
VIVVDPLERLAVVVEDLGQKVELFGWSQVPGVKAGRVGVAARLSSRTAETAES